MIEPRTRSQNGRRSRSKGACWEREVASLFAALFPGKDVRRNIAQARTAKREGCDVLGTPWWIECKVGATIDLRGALEQAERDSSGAPCIVVAKQDRREPVVHARLRVLWYPLDISASHPEQARLTPAATMRLSDFLTQWVSKRV